MEPLTKDSTRSSDAAYTSERKVLEAACEFGVNVRTRTPMGRVFAQEESGCCSAYYCIGPYDSLVGFTRHLEDGDLPWEVRQVRISNSSSSSRDPRAVGMEFLLELPDQTYGQP